VANAEREHRGLERHTRRERQFHLHDHRRRRDEPGRTALDVEELLGAQGLRELAIDLGEPVEIALAYCILGGIDVQAGDLAAARAQVFANLGDRLHARNRVAAELAFQGGEIVPLSPSERICSGPVTRAATSSRLR